MMTQHIPHHFHALTTLLRIETKINTVNIPFSLVQKIEQELCHCHLCMMLSVQIKKPFAWCYRFRYDSTKLALISNWRQNWNNWFAFDRANQKFNKPSFYVQSKMDIKIEQNPRRLRWLVEISKPQSTFLSICFSTKAWD